MAHLHIADIQPDILFCIGLYNTYVNVEGKRSKIDGLEDMGTFPFSHCFLLAKEEQLCLFILSACYCILWPPNEH